jgi:hypothetical protein
MIEAVAGFWVWFWGMVVTQLWWQAAIEMGVIGNMPPTVALALWPVTVPAQLVMLWMIKPR